MPTLDVPSSIRPTPNATFTGTDGEARGWIVNPFGIHKPFPAWAVFFTAVPACR